MTQSQKYLSPGSLKEKQVVQIDDGAVLLLSLLFCMRKRVDLQTAENACPFAQISIFHTAQEQIATNDLATSILFFFSR